MRSLDLKCEIATTVEQQERVVTQQATAVNQTITTMDELNASSWQSVNQAEATNNGSNHALKVAHNGVKK